MLTFIGGAGWLQVRLPSNRKFLLNLDPCRLNRNCESRNSNEFLFRAFMSDSGASKGYFTSFSVLLKLFKILRQSLKFFDSAMYVLKLVHQASTPKNRKTFCWNCLHHRKYFQFSLIFRILNEISYHFQSINKIHVICLVSKELLTLKVFSSLIVSVNKN